MLEGKVMPRTMMYWVKHGSTITEGKKGRSSNGFFSFFTNEFGVKLMGTFRNEDTNTNGAEKQIKI